MKHIGVHIFMLLPVTALLAVVWGNPTNLPVGELAGQWSWLGKACVLFAVCVFIMLLVGYKNKNITIEYP